MRWVIDGNNVYGSRPDGWWNDRDRAAGRFAQRVAEWCRTHDDDVTIVFDAPVSSATLELAGGNLRIVEAPHRGRDAADDHIVELVELVETVDGGPAAGPGAPVAVTVVTSDRGLRRRLSDHVDVMGVARFREIVRY